MKRNRIIARVLLGMMVGVLFLLVYLAGGLLTALFVVGLSVGSVVIGFGIGMLVVWIVENL